MAKHLDSQKQFICVLIQRLFPQNYWCMGEGTSSLWASQITHFVFEHGFTDQKKIPWLCL